MFEEICLCFLSLLGTEMVDKLRYITMEHGDFMSNNRIVLVLRNKPLSRLEMHPFRGLNNIATMDPLPDTEKCGLRLRRECRERFPRHRVIGNR